jgi:hypothetical protein
MKKYYLNPQDIFISVFLMLLTGGLFVTILISTIINISKQSVDLGIAIVFLSIPLLLMIPQICYINKYCGYMVWDDNRLIFKKGKKQKEVEISNIRWIELRYDYRGGSKGRIGNEKNFRFFIRLNNQKENLDFVITNQIILDIIKKYNIRIMPDQYNQIYIDTGEFKFK